MKSVTIQHIEAIARLKATGYVPRRNVFVLIVPDEELGGVRGMKLLLGNAFFKDVNPGVVIDEGLASTDSRYSVFYAEVSEALHYPGRLSNSQSSLLPPSVQRKIWWILVRATGPAGHGSRFVQGTAVEKLMRMANKVLAFREEQAAELAASCGCGKQLGDFTTMNLTMVSGGMLSLLILPCTFLLIRPCCVMLVFLWGCRLEPFSEPRHAVSLQLKAGSLDQHQFNVIPTVAEAGFDCRIPATVDLVAFRRRLDEWCAADPGVTYELVAGSETRATEHAVSDISEGSYWWSIFQAACTKVSRAVILQAMRHYAPLAFFPQAGLELHPPSVFPAATDSRWIRLVLGTPCFGFSPIRRTPILLHDHDEHVPISVFLEGIQAFEALLPTLADAPPEPVPAGGS